MVYSSPFACYSSVCNDHFSITLPSLDHSIACVQETLPFPSFCRDLLILELVVQDIDYITVKAPISKHTWDQKKCHLGEVICTYYMGGKKM